MSDTAITEVPAEPMPPAPPEAAAATAPEVESEDNRTARQRVLDHLTDSEGEQSVEQILAGTGLNRNACEQAIFRAKKAEQIIWVAPGVYALAPPKPSKPLPSSRNGHSNEEWVARIEAWQVNPASWNVEEDGPPPNDPNHRIPLDVVGRFKDRQAREAKEREKREAAAARQAAADAELRNQLLATCRGNFMPGPGLDDLSPIKLILETVPLDYVLYAIRQKVDRRCFPGNPPLASWRDPKFLRAVADNYCGGVVIPSMVAAWEAAGKAPATKTHQSLPPVRHMPDDIDRSHHDSAWAAQPSLPKPPAASAAPGVRGKPADASEASPVVPPAPSDQENASMALPAQINIAKTDIITVANPDDGPATDAEPVALDAKRPDTQPTRDSILAAFNRSTGGAGEKKSGEPTAAAPAGCGTPRGCRKRTLLMRPT